MQVKEMKADLNKWRDIVWWWIRIPNIAKTSILDKLIYRFKANPIKFPEKGFFFLDTDKIIFKLILKGKETSIAKRVMRKINKKRGISLSDFKTCCKPAIIKDVWYWQRNIHIDQWNRVEYSKINAHRLAQLIFYEGAKAVQWRKESLSYRSN